MKTTPSPRISESGILAFLLLAVLTGSACSGGNDSDEEKAVALFIRGLEAFNNRTPEVLDEIWAPSYKYYYNSSPTPTDRTSKSFYDFNITYYPDFTFDIQEVIAEGDMLAARFVFEGTKVGCRGPVKIVIHWFGRLENNKFVEVWELIDDSALQQQLAFTCTST